LIGDNYAGDEAICQSRLIALKMAVEQLRVALFPHPPDDLNR